MLCQLQGRREVGGGPGQIFLGAPIKKFFPEKKFFGEQQPPPCPQLFNEKNFPEEYVAIAFQGLYPSNQLASCFTTAKSCLTTVLNCNCCSQFAHHHVITQITESHFVPDNFLLYHEK